MQRWLREPLVHFIALGALLFVLDGYLRADEDLGRDLDSLRAVLELDFETVFCAHRGVLPVGRDALRRKLDRLVAFGEEARALRARGLSLRRITRRLLGREDFTTLDTGGHYSKANLVRGCLGLPGGDGP